MSDEEERRLRSAEGASRSPESPIPEGADPSGRAARSSGIGPSERRSGIGPSESRSGTGPSERPKRRGPRGYRVPVFEGWIDRQIREAIERGEFDNLPGAGKPIPNLDERDENWWIKGKLEREGIKPPLPNALALRREVEEIQRTLADVRTETEAREIIDDLNERVRELYLYRDRGPLIVVRTVPVEPTLEEWRRRRSTTGDA